MIKNNRKVVSDDEFSRSCLGHVRYKTSGNFESNTYQPIYGNNKFGKFTPGSNIKIVSKQKMRLLNPKYMLVLIWSFRSEVIKQEINYIKRGGKLIFHLPFYHTMQ